MAALKFDKWARLKRHVAGQHLAMIKHAQFLGDTAAADEPNIKAKVFDKLLTCMNHLEKEDLKEVGMNRVNIHTWYSETREVEVVDNVMTGSALRKLRKRAGISLRGLAKLMKISPSYLSDLENGNRNWDKIKHNQFVEFCSVKETK